MLLRMGNLKKTRSFPFIDANLDIPGPNKFLLSTWVTVFEKFHISNIQVLIGTYPCLPSSPLFLISWAVKDTVYQERVKMKMTLIQHNFKSPTPTLVLLLVILLTPTSVMSPSAEASSKPCSSYGIKLHMSPVQCRYATAS